MGRGGAARWRLQRVIMGSVMGRRAAGCGTAKQTGLEADCTTRAAKCFRGAAFALRAGRQAAGCGARPAAAAAGCQMCRPCRRCMPRRQAPTPGPPSHLPRRPSGWSGRSTTCDTHAITRRWACRWAPPRRKPRRPTASWHSSGTPTRTRVRAPAGAGRCGGPARRSPEPRTPSHVSLYCGVAVELATHVEQP